MSTEENRNFYFETELDQLDDLDLRYQTEKSLSKSLKPVEIPQRAAKKRTINGILQGMDSLFASLRKKNFLDTCDNSNFQNLSIENTECEIYYLNEDSSISPYPGKTSSLEDNIEILNIKKQPSIFDIQVDEYGRVINMPPGANINSGNQQDMIKESITLYRIEEQMEARRKYQVLLGGAGFNKMEKVRINSQSEGIADYDGMAAGA